MDVAQEVQDRAHEIPQLPSSFLLDVCDATCNTNQFCAFNSHLLLIQLRDPSATLHLVGEVQLCVHYFVYDTTGHPRIPDAPVMIDVLSAALDASYAIGVVFIFFALQYPYNGTIGLHSIQTWWGNTVYLDTADAKGTPFKTLADGQTFGPTTW
jgi:hypothetical protein